MSLSCYACGASQLSFQLVAAASYDTHEVAAASARPSPVMLSVLPCSSGGAEVDEGPAGPVPGALAVNPCALGSKPSSFHSV